MKEYIDIKDIEKERKKEALIRPFKKSYSFVQGKINQAIKSQQQKINIKKSISDKIAQGQISDTKDVEKEYAYGSSSYNYAMQKIRQKQLSQAREQAMFDARKKFMAKNIAHSLNKKSKPIKLSAQNYGSLNAIWGNPVQPIKQSSRKKSKKSKPLQLNKNINDMIWKM